MTPAGCLLGMAAACLVAGRAAADEPVTAAATQDVGTVITSTRLNFEHQLRRAVFEENVEVTDRDVTIRSDRLTVHFSEDNKAERIEAEGRVSIVRQDLVATGERALYTVPDGKLQLTGRPLIRGGRDQLSGETVTLWRDSKRILCEPNARLVILSGSELGMDAR